MYKKNGSIIFILSLLTSLVNAQTVVDYYAWNPPNPACDVLAAAVNISGIQHQSQIGQTYYSTSARSLSMDCRYVSSSSYLGMKYRLAYNFKQGYSYEIKVNANVNVHANGVDQDPRLRLDLSNNSGGGAGTVCNGPQSVNPSFAGNPAAQKIDDVTLRNYTFSFGTLGINSSTLEISCIPYAGAGTKTVGISRITITEIPPPVSFAIASSHTSIPCGSSTPVTFTVNNGGSGTPTGYTWNLGPTPNGWLYNGTAAPATIPTLATQNTIQLTPVCGSTLSNVSATVTANGVNYTTNSSAVTVTLPDLSINGSDALCSGSSPYFINNLPCNAAVSWQATPSGIVTFGSPNDPQTSISPSGTGR